MLAALAAIAGAALYFLSPNDEPPVEYGDTCYAAEGYCPLQQGLPVGASCTCIDDFGVAHPGSAG